MATVFFTCLIDILQISTLNFISALICLFVCVLQLVAIAPSSRTENMTKVYFKRQRQKAYTTLLLVKTKSHDSIFLTIVI